MGECSYETGNITAANNVEYLRQVLKTSGISEDRLRIEFCSAAEGYKFVKIVKEMTEVITKLGPNPIIMTQSSVK